MNNFRETLLKNWPGLNESQYLSLIQYFDLAIQESKVQNITRLLEPEDFFWGHFNDIRVWLENFDVSGKFLDLGSGLGVPGIPLAIAKPSVSIVLAESELRKAKFLSKCVTSLNLSPQVTVHYGRGEDFLKANSVDWVISRATGTVAKIVELLSGCSTWNGLVLFKGPRWEKEWEEVTNQKKWAGKFYIERDYSYSEPHKNRQLRIVSVLRGTKATS